MDPARLVASLERTLPALLALTEGLSPAAAAWRPEPGVWSTLEIVAHMLDEEIEDFRPRLRRTLEDPAAPWPPIDPESWVAARDYAGRDLTETVARLGEERRASLAWLRGLDAPDWSLTHEHAQGPVRAGDILAAWAAHDLLHLRQLAQRAFQRLTGDAEPYHPDYAGGWPAG